MRVISEGALLLWLIATASAIVLSFPPAFEAWKDCRALRQLGVGNGRMHFAKSKLRIRAAKLTSLCLWLLIGFLLLHDWHWRSPIALWVIRTSLVASPLVLAIDGIMDQLTYWKLRRELDHVDWRYPR